MIRLITKTVQSRKKVWIISFWPVASKVKSKKKMNIEWQADTTQENQLDFFMDKLK